MINQQVQKSPDLWLTSIGIHWKALHNWARNRRGTSQLKPILIQKEIKFVEKITHFNYWIRDGRKNTKGFICKPDVLIKLAVFVLLLHERWR